MLVRYYLEFISIEYLLEKRENLKSISSTLILRNYKKEQINAKENIGKEIKIRLRVNEMENKNSKEN